jgi:hypothetical protein
MTQEKVLGFKPPARLEQANNEDPERVKSHTSLAMMRRFRLSTPIRSRMEFSERTGRTPSSCKALFQTSIKRLTAKDGAVISDAMKKSLWALN